MEAMTVTNEKTLQQGLNDVVINKVQRMIDGKAVGVQATMERLISEGKIAQDYIAPIGVNLRQKDHSPVITFNGGERLFKFYEDMEARIKSECDPQEVYCYEYNNHECCIAFDGDIEAIRLVARIWGVETAKTIKRRSAFYRVEELFKNN